MTTIYEWARRAALHAGGSTRRRGELWCTRRLHPHRAISAFVGAGRSVAEANERARAKLIAYMVRERSVREGLES